MNETGDSWWQFRDQLGATLLVGDELAVRRAVCLHYTLELIEGRSCFTFKFIYLSCTFAQNNLQVST